jgi:hypothetical protein
VVPVGQLIGRDHPYFGMALDLGKERTDVEVDHVVLQRAP